MTTNIQRISDAEYSATLAAGRTEGKIEIRARAVRYGSERDAIEIVTSHDVSLLIPRQWVGALWAPDSDLAGYAALKGVPGTCLKWWAV
jgi:hypothetical protein